ncbi:hypothetical protein CEUSTIGMA_g5419.t1 [Chlamydomonas eustigma]|uniref:Uncharacterized protein n=1 Tax=Chlamydomonas eustigma TaxID=1157962 RepID=A0A250X4G7_9CHLO|nr:hypothetical protein CEUSTIGMA_g5419.t1 [Chlamydomonas eustigma]|eukprot:GAX77977.1 hypothetical protein CEUSTIGMA_g5419.t1 [Chlamydomonas eustigma]
MPDNGLISLVEKVEKLKNVDNEDTVIIQKKRFFKLLRDKNIIPEKREEFMSMYLAYEALHVLIQRKKALHGNSNSRSRELLQDNAGNPPSGVQAAGVNTEKVQGRLQKSVAGVSQVTKRGQMLIKSAPIKATMSRSTATAAIPPNRPLGGNNSNHFIQPSNEQFYKNYPTAAGSNQQHFMAPTKQQGFGALRARRESQMDFDDLNVVDGEGVHCPTRKSSGQGTNTTSTTRIAVHDISGSPTIQTHGSQQPRRVSLPSSLQPAVSITKRIQQQNLCSKSAKPSVHGGSRSLKWPGPQMVSTVVDMMKPKAITEQQALGYLPRSAETTDGGDCLVMGTNSCHELAGGFKGGRRSQPGQLQAAAAAAGGGERNKKGLTTKTAPAAVGNKQSHFVS